MSERDLVAHVTRLSARQYSVDLGASPFSRLAVAHAGWRGLAAAVLLTGMAAGCGESGDDPGSAGGKASATAEVAADIDPRKLASLIFRPGFTTVGEAGARGIGIKRQAARFRLTDEEVVSGSAPSLALADLDWPVATPLAEIPASRTPAGLLSRCVALTRGEAADLGDARRLAGAARVECVTPLTIALPAIWAARVPTRCTCT